MFGVFGVASVSPANMKALAIAILGLALLPIARGDDFPFVVANPRDSKNAIGEYVRHLIAHLQEPKPGGFISAADATKNLKWRVEHMNIVSEDVVAVIFTEGHIEVIGIYVRNYKDRAWDLKAEINGSFKTRSFSDDSLKTPK